MTHFDKKNLNIPGLPALPVKYVFVFSKFLYVYIYIFLTQVVQSDTDKPCYFKM